MVGREHPPETPLPKNIPSNTPAFPKDRHGEICRRTNITRASCIRNPENQDGHLPRATKFGEQITADHKVLSKEGESRLQHRFDIVVQYLASHGSRGTHVKKPKTSPIDVKSLRKFLEPEEDPKHCTPTQHRSESNSIAEGAVRRAKEGTSTVRVLSGLAASQIIRKIENHQQRIRQRRHTAFGRVTSTSTSSPTAPQKFRPWAASGDERVECSQIQSTSAVLCRQSEPRCS